MGIWHILAWMYACMHVCMYVCMYSCVYAVCMHACMYAHKHVEICISMICIDTYIHSRTHMRSNTLHLAVCMQHCYMLQPHERFLHATTACKILAHMAKASPRWHPRIFHTSSASKYPNSPRTSASSSYEHSQYFPGALSVGALSVGALSVFSIQTVSQDDAKAGFEAAHLCVLVIVTNGRSGCWAQHAVTVRDSATVALETHNTVHACKIANAALVNFPSVYHVKERMMRSI